MEKQKCDKCGKEYYPYELRGAGCLQIGDFDLNCGKGDLVCTITNTCPACMKKILRHSHVNLTRVNLNEIWRGEALASKQEERAFGGLYALGDSEETGRKEERLEKEKE